MKFLTLFLLSTVAAFATAWQRNGITIYPTVASPAITGSSINGRAGVSAVNGITVVLDSEVQTWVTSISAASGTGDLSTLVLGTNLAVNLRAESYSSKIIYLVPFFGTNLQACVCALRNTLAVASMGVVGAGSATCTQATGLVGDGAVQFTLRINPGQLGASGAGGLGYWENNVNYTGSGVEPVGTYNTAGTERYVLDLRNTSSTFRWGTDIGGGPSQASAAVNAHYYGQNVNSTSRSLSINGTSVATSTNVAVVAGIANNEIRVIGCWDGVGTTFWKGRCALVYLTDGTMSAGDITAFDTFLRTWVFTPTGRPTS